MRSWLVRFIVFCSLFSVPATGFAGNGPDAGLYERLVPLHAVKKKPGPYDWLSVHREPGQTFADFTQAQPAGPDRRKDKIYIALLGDFDPVREEIVRKAARYIHAFYGLPVEFSDPIPLSAIPESARRVHPVTRDPQILSTYVIERVLIPRRPDDAFCFIAFSSADLWPGEGWNFVFGQASLEDRVGVWSVYRNGDPNADVGAYDLCLRRTISTGIHEIGHMFSMAHCIFYECAMNGSNHRRESDARPLWLCPVDLRKLCHLLGVNPLERYKNLATISRELGLKGEAAFFEKSIAALEGR